MQFFLTLLFLLTFINFLNAPKKPSSPIKIEVLNSYQRERVLQNLEPAKNQITNFFKDYLCTPLFPSFCKSIIPGKIPDKLVCKDINQFEPINLVKRSQELFKDSTSAGWMLYQELFLQNAQMFSLFVDYLTICYFQVICFEKTKRIAKHEVELRSKLAGSLFETIKSLFFKKKRLEEAFRQQEICFSPKLATTISNIQSVIAAFYQGFDFSDYQENPTFSVLEKIFNCSLKNQDIDIADQENCIFFISLEGAPKDEYFHAKFKSFLTEFVSEEEIVGLISLKIIPDYNFSESCSLVIPIDLEDFINTQRQEGLADNFSSNKDSSSEPSSCCKEQKSTDKNLAEKFFVAPANLRDYLLSFDSPFRANPDDLDVLSKFELPMFEEIYSNLLEKTISLSKKSFCYADENQLLIENQNALHQEISFFVKNIEINLFKNQESKMTDFLQTQKEEMISLLQRQEVDQLTFFQNLKSRPRERQQLVAQSYLKEQNSEKIQFLEQQQKNKELLFKDQPWKEKFCILKFLLQLRVFILILQINHQGTKNPFEMAFLKDLVYRACAFCPDLKIYDYFDFFVLKSDQDGACCRSSFSFDLDSALKSLLLNNFELPSAKQGFNAWADGDLDYAYQPKLLKDCYKNASWSNVDLLRYNLMSIQRCFGDDVNFFHLKADCLHRYLLASNDILDPRLGYFFRV